MLYSCPGNFYPRSPQGERLARFRYLVLSDSISIHALRKESDKIPYQCKIDKENFYPRSPQGERRWSLSRCQTRLLFLSTLSARRATAMIITICIVPKFLSTLSARRATRLYSIFRICARYFYPRSPQGERQIITSRSNRHRVFLSTLSARRATRRAAFCLLSSWYFYPRSPQGERPGIRRLLHGSESISIHALRKESDQCRL